MAQIFRQHGQDYAQQFGITPEQQPVIKAVMACRTHLMGGTIDQCDHCGHKRQRFHSCRNRHCPKCQSCLAGRWFLAKEKELLPVDYFHLVFTLPHELNQLCLANKREITNLFFAVVSTTLLRFGQSPQRRLGGKLGFIAILHSWDQKLLDHFHIHCLIPAGALANDGTRWIPASPRFLFSVKALSQAFRKTFLRRLVRLLKKGDLNFEATGTQSLDIDDMLRKQSRKNWVVFAKPLVKPRLVLKYLSRYVHRVPLDNRRISSLSEGMVTFRCRVRKKGQPRQITIRAEEFIRRFLLHVFPSGLMRIRAYGFLANNCKKRHLATLKRLLGGLGGAGQKSQAVPLLCLVCQTGRMLTITYVERTCSTVTLTDMLSGAVTFDSS